MLKEIIISFSAFDKDYKMVNKYRLWNWVIFIGFFYISLLFAGLYFFGISASYLASDQLVEVLGIRKWAEGIQSGMVNFFLSFTGLVLWLCGFLIYISIFKNIWIILMNPFLSHFSRKIIALENRERGYHKPAKPYFWLAGFGRGIHLALRNLLWTLVYFTGLIFCAFIPVFGWVVPFFGLLIEAYFLGFNLIDLGFKARERNLSESILFNAGHKGLGIGNGLAFYALHLVPIVGWFLAPSFCVIAATLSVSQDERENV